MRVLFAGTPDIAVPALRRAAAAVTVCGVLTNPDRVRARGAKVLPSPVKAAAEELGIPVIQPERLLAEARAQAASLNPDLLVTYAYGRIFGPKFLSLFPMGGINVHPSLLPELRGSSPIQSAILYGLKRTGITVQQIVLETDSGGILLQEPVDLDGTETTESLTPVMAERGAQLLAEVLQMLEKGTAAVRGQDHRAATYCRKIEKGDRFIDWNKSAELLSREVRAFYPWPKAAAGWDGRTLMVTYALPVPDKAVGLAGCTRPKPGTVLSLPHAEGIPVVCGDGVLLLKRLQLEAKKELDYIAFRNGNPDITSARLS